MIILKDRDKQELEIRAEEDDSMIGLMEKYINSMFNCKDIKVIGIINAYKNGKLLCRRVTILDSDKESTVEIKGI